MRPTLPEAHHDYPGAGLDMVKIDHGLGGAGGHHSRQGGAPEVQVVLVGAGGNDDLFGSDGLHAVLAAVQGQVVLKNAVDRMAQQDLHVVRFRVRQQMLADVEAPHAGVVLPGAKELVDLLKELTARLLVFVDDQHLGAPAGRRDTGGKARRTRADDQDINFPHACSSFPPRPYWVSTVMPSSTGVTQVRVLGTPLTIILQSLQRPMPQKMLRAVCCLAV